MCLQVSKRQDSRASSEHPSEGSPASPSGENDIQENLLPVAQEPLELETRRTGAPVHPGLLEHSIVRASYLKEAFQLLWAYHQPARTEQHLRRLMHSAMRSRLQPSSKLVRRLRSHVQGDPRADPAAGVQWRARRMNNKIKLVSRRSFGFRTVKHFSRRRSITAAAIFPYRRMLITGLETSHK
jgi:hypothetical protein